MLTRDQKAELVKETTQKIGESKSVVFVDYKGLGVADTEELKKQLRAEQVEYRVIKKKLLLRAAAESRVDVDPTLLEGQLAVAFSLADEVSAAKVIATFAKDRKDLKILGGILGDNVMLTENVKALAKLPSKEELLGKLVGTIKAPLNGFVQVLNGNTRGLVQALKAIADQRQQ